MPNTPPISQDLDSLLRALRTQILIMVNSVDALSAHAATQKQRTLASPLSISPPSPDRFDARMIKLDRTTLSVRWRGKECAPGYTYSYRILECLLQHVGKFWPTHELVKALWSAQRAPLTIRSAVSDRRLRLISAGMGDLALLIDGSNRGHHRLILPLNDSPATTTRRKSDGRPTANQQRTRTHDVLSLCTGRSSSAVQRITRPPSRSSIFMNPAVTHLPVRNLRH